MSDLSIRSTYFTAQYSNNQLSRDLLRGLKAMRGERDTSTNSAQQQSYYLPKFPEEPQPVYEQRVRRSYLTNYFARALDSDSGKILAKTIGLAQGENQPLPDDYTDWLADTDLEGKPLSVLARDQLKAGMAKGLALAYVDYTQAKRPFVREIDIDDVLAFRADDITGRLTMLRWQDSMPVDSEDEGIINANVVFEITPTEWKLYRLDDEDDNGFDQPDDMGEIVRYRNGSERITDELPVSLFYTNKKGKLLADTPYRTLMELTLEHFQVYSDLKNMLFYALQPILFGNGMPEDLQLKALASYMFVKLPEGYKEASLEWIQVDAGVIEQARKQLDDIQQRIASFSIDNSAIKPGNQTATQSAIDASGANAALRAFADGLEEHLERILEIMWSYTVAPDLDINVDIQPDFSVKDNIEDLKLLQADVKDGNITLETYLKALVTHGLLPEGFDIEAEVEKLDEAVGAGALSGSFL